MKKFGCMQARLSLLGIVRTGLHPGLEGPGTSSGDSEIHSVAAIVEIGDSCRHKRIVWSTQKGLHLVTA